MPYAQIDTATAEMIDNLLKANVLQLILLVPVLIVTLQLINAVVAFFRSRQQSDGDDKIINRMIDIADKANTNTAALTTAINSLNETQRETRSIHQMNRDSILAQQEAVNTLVINVQNLGRQHLNWGKLVDENLTNLDGTLKNLRTDLQQLSNEVQHLQSLADNPALQTHLDSVLKAMAKDMLSKLDAILQRLPKDPPPTPPGNEAQPLTPRTPTDADGAKDATVDLALMPPERKEDAA